jgi:hypothetical protein
MDYVMTSYISETLMAGVAFRPDSTPMTNYLQIGGGGSSGVSINLVSTMNVGIGRGG